MNTNTKQASLIVPGDKIYTTEDARTPTEVVASYPLGNRWAIEVKGVALILQLDPEDQVVWFPYK